MIELGTRNSVPHDEIPDIFGKTDILVTSPGLGEMMKTRVPMIHIKMSCKIVPNEVEKQCNCQLGQVRSYITT